MQCIIITIKTKIKSRPDVVNYFKEIPFYNKPIEKRKIKRLKTLIYFLNFLFYEELNIIKINHAFRGHEIIELKDPILQLEASKSSIKDLLSVSDLLNETKGFNYQITVKVFLEKNTSQIEKFNLGQFILIQQQKQG